MIAHAVYKSFVVITRMRDIHNTHHRTLSKGLVLNSMRDNGLNEIAAALSDVESKNGVDLFAWTRDLLTETCTTAV